MPPRGLGRTPCRHPCWTESLLVEVYHNRRKSQNDVGSAFATLTWFFGRSNPENRVEPPLLALNLTITPTDVKMMSLGVLSCPIRAPNSLTRPVGPSNSGIMPCLCISCYPLYRGKIRCPIQGKTVSQLVCARVPTDTVITDHHNEQRCYSCPGSGSSTACASTSPAPVRVHSPRRSCRGHVTHHAAGAASALWRTGRESIPSP